MLKKFTTSLSKPPLAIFFIKDSWSKIILYIFMIPILMIIPAFILSFTQPGMPHVIYQEINQVMAEDFRLENTYIENYHLVTTEHKAASLDYYQFAVGSYEEQNRMTFVFGEDGITLMVLSLEADYMSYQELNLENYDFSSTDQQDIYRLTNAIRDIYNEQTYIEVGNILAQYFIYLFDYVVVILIMAILSQMIAPMLRMPFNMRFKLSTYLSTVYVVINLIAALTAQAWLTYVSILVVYVYHIWAFRSIKIIPKGVGNGRQ